MAVKMLESSALSAFCENIAMMHSAGIQTDEAVHLLSENMEDAEFSRACDTVYRSLIDGNTLAESMRTSQVFPAHAINMVEAGENSGRLENTLVSLARYYDEEDRLFSKMKSAITYPAALLVIMTIILLFTVSTILPVFIDAYEGLAGSLTAGSYTYVNASIIIGWIALAITLASAILVIIGIFLTQSQNGQIKLVRILERMPGTRKPLKQMALSRFTSALATYVASGIDTNTAMEEAIATVDHAQLRKALEHAYEEMLDPDKAKSLAQTIYDNEIYEPIYARMLIIGTRSGSLENVLGHLSDLFFDDAIDQVDGTIDNVEPLLAAFLTIGVGATLISVMLPLIGIMGSIG